MSHRRTKLAFIKRYKPYIVSTVIGAFVGAALLVIFSVLMFLFQLPTEWAGVLALLALGASSLTAGFIIGKYRRKNGISLGAKMGLILFFFCLIGALVTGNLNGSDALGKLICSLAGGLFGGVCGVNSKNRL